MINMINFSLVFPCIKTSNLLKSSFIYVCIGGDHPPRPPGLLLSRFFLRAQVLSICVSECLVAPSPGRLPVGRALWCMWGFKRGPYLSTPAKLPSTQRHSHPRHPSIFQLRKGSCAYLLTPWLSLCFPYLLPWRSVFEVRTSICSTRIHMVISHFPV